MNQFVKKAQVKKVYPDGLGLPNHTGLVTVNSNATTATVSTTSVRSDSFVFAQTLTMLAASAFAVGVDSRVDGVSFAVTMVADAAIAHPIGWAILG